MTHSSDEVEGDADTGRRAFRAFVRTHHPDRGGDPEAFVAGLAAFRRVVRVPGQQLRFHRRRRGLSVPVGWWLDRRARRRRPPRVH